MGGGNSAHRVLVLGSWTCDWPRLAIVAGAEHCIVVSYIGWVSRVHGGGVGTFV